jgi:hypothetical protein
MDVAASEMCGWKRDERAKGEKAGVEELYSRRRVLGDFGATRPLSQQNWGPLPAFLT